jgi:hypothetical protein
MERYCSTGQSPQRAVAPTKERKKILVHGYDQIKSTMGICSSHGATAPSELAPPHYRSFTITLRHTTLGRTPLDELSAQCRDLYLTTRNTHKRHTSTTPAGFEPTILAIERPQTHTLDRAATRIEQRWALEF